MDAGHKLEPVVVTKNDYGGSIDIDILEEHNSTITVKQGGRYAQLVGDIPLLIATNLAAGDVLQPVQGIRNGKLIARHWRIIIKESLEPFDVDDPEIYIKKKDGKTCTKDGKIIYTHSYVSYEEDEFDEIIEPDDMPGL
jgi:hypothetical protein